MIKQIFFIALLFILLPQAEATHLVGGDITHEFLDKTADGNSRYRITVTILRDCANGIPTDPEITLGIYLATNNTLSQKVKVHRAAVKPDSRTNRCYDLSNDVCLERSIYETIITLTPNTDGYRVAYERCCRTYVSNIIEDQGGGIEPSQGFQLQTFIYSDLQNSSALFLDYAFISPIYDTSRLYFSTLDPDGDSVVIKTIKPLKGQDDALLSEAEPSDTLVVDSINYKPGYSKQHPFGISSFFKESESNISMHINDVGRFYLSFMLEEYRNGKLISSRNLDFLVVALDLPSTSKTNSNLPSGLIGVNSSNLEAQLSWDNCINEVEYYRIFRETEGKSGFELIDSTAQLSYTDETTDISEDYKYFVQGVSNSVIPSGNSDTISIRFKRAGVEQQLKNSFFHYPNPSSDKFHIQSELSIDQISVYTIGGKQLINHIPLEKNKATIDISSLPSGLFIIEVYSDKTRHISRLLVE